MKRSGLWTFLVAWSGQVVSTLGSGLTSFALGVWLYQRTGAATQWTFLVFIYGAATVLALPWAGAVVDRWDRRKVLIVSDSGAAVGTIILATLVWTGRLEPWHVYAAAAITAAFNAFQMPAFQATVPLLVSKEQLGRTAGLTNLGLAIPGVVGPFLAGALVESVGLPVILLIDLATFGVAVLTLLLVQFPRPKESAESAAARGTLRREIAFGWRYIQERPGLLALLFMFAGVNFCLGMLQSLLPPMVLGFTTPEVLGRVMALAGIGMVVGSILMSVWGGPKRRIVGIFSFLCVIAAILFLAGFQPSATLIASAGFLFTLCFPIINGCSAVIWQRKVAPDVLGRTTSLQRVVALGALPLAALIAGPLADHVFEPLLAVGGPLADSVGRVIGVGPGRGIALLFIVLGVLIYLVLAWGWRNPRLRNVESEIPDAVPDEPAPAAEPVPAAGSH